MTEKTVKKPLINEEWLIVLLGFIVLGLIILAPRFMNNIKMLNVSSLTTGAGWLNTALTFVFLFVVIVVAALISRKPL